jgi:hypothetical protein
VAAFGRSAHSAAMADLCAWTYRVFQEDDKTWTVEVTTEPGTSPCFAHFETERDAREYKSKLETRARRGAANDQTLRRPW